MLVLVLLLSLLCFTEVIDFHRKMLVVCSDVLCFAEMLQDTPCPDVLRRVVLPCPLWNEKGREPRRDQIALCVSLEHVHWLSLIHI